MTPAPKTVRICYLYPRLLSVAGDRGNLFALTQRCAWRGIRYSVTEADVGEVPDFAQADLILMHGGQDREMDVALTGTPTGEPLYIFAGYTPMRELRSVMQRRGWVRPSWKE